MARILIVDDEPAFCDCLKTLLRSHGHEVLTAYSGRDALDAFTQLRPQFTLLDLRMPGMNGIETLRYIRKMDPKANVMIMTAWGSDELEQQARQLGAQDFLSKALSLNTIVSTMEGMLSPGKAPALNGGTAGTRETPSILLVDDDPKARDLFVQTLRKNGLTMHTAQDVLTVMQVVDKERPQFVVVDVEMPNGVGREVLRKLRARTYGGGLILLTSTQNAQLLEAAPDLGSVDILTKPVEAEKLLVAIQIGLVHMPQ